MSNRRSSQRSIKTKYGKYTAATVKTYRNLGIIDRQGNPIKHMLEACKILKIDLKELESKTYEDFL
jgi:hypothetical protein